MWNLVYVVPPDFLIVEQGTRYMSHEMREKLSGDGVNLLEAPIETPGSIGVVDHYHAPLHSAFVKMRTALDCSTSVD